LPGKEVVLTDGLELDAQRPKRPGKKLVIFADGTGNAFSVQESNVWRLYQALDKSEKPQGLQQIARYIPGVGTSGNRLIRTLDGMTGFGVPSNVRKLYRFLCWNWDPDDEIYLFGFSRGAFTVRTLASMIYRQGLLARRVADGPDGATRVVGKSEMQRNVAAAWRAYRWKTAPLVEEGKSALNPLNWKMNPLIEVVRYLRNGVVWLKRRVMGQEQHEEVLARRHDRALDGVVKVRMLGVFDTVEAYGLPVAELSDVVNWAIWPLQFRNFKCSRVVQKVRHALALDDERLTFRPLRFDQRELPEGQEIQELWFAGMHSDVGGGYPDNAVSLDPLVWMKSEAQLQELRFDDLIMMRHERGRYPQAQIHDSRAGLASLYRYAPRTFEADSGDPEETNGSPVLHHSTLRKMQVGADGYAPLLLPADFRVYPDNGQRWSGVAPHDLPRNEAAAGEVRRLVGRRKLTNWITIGCILALIALPFLPEDFLGIISRDMRLNPKVLSWAEWLIGGLVPGWAYTWVVALLNNWVISLVLIGAVLVIHQVNESLGNRIKDWANQIWR
jgi:uncharacterized protein (DUF2235 family)